MRMKFDDLYGSDENDIQNWHKLCHDLKIDPPPATLQGCRDVCLSSLTVLDERLFIFIVTGCTEYACQSRRPC
jgi:hypothetical protein